MSKLFRSILSRSYQSRVGFSIPCIVVPRVGFRYKTSSPSTDPSNLRELEDTKKTSLETEATLTELRKKENALTGTSGTGKDCNNLKKALLHAEVKNGFLCLPGSEVFPTASSKDGDGIPSKLFMREFHKELKLILEITKDCIFVGPSGIGKSWCAMAVLVDELKKAQTADTDNDHDKPWCVVYFDSGKERAYVFNKHSAECRSTSYMSSITIPSVVDIPELQDENTLLIYDIARCTATRPPGWKAQFAPFPCRTLIFAPPRFTNSSDMKRFVVPCWTKEELQTLAKACFSDGHEQRKDNDNGNGEDNNNKPLSISTNEVSRRFDLFGGSPRRVLFSDPIAVEKQILASIPKLVQSGPNNSPLMISRCTSDELATTPQEAVEKYLDENTQYDCISPFVRELVFNWMSPRDN